MKAPVISTGSFGPPLPPERRLKKVMLNLPSTRLASTWVSVSDPVRTLKKVGARRVSLGGNLNTAWLLTAPVDVETGYLRTSGK